MPSPLVIGAAFSLALAAASLQLPSGPSYDPYAWLIWGRDLAHLGLSTRGGGTSWKPLPALIDAFLTPLGGGAAGAWLVVARAGGLFALVMAFRLAWRLAPRGTRALAGLVAAATLALTHEWFVRNGVGNAEGLMVAFGLLAIDRHLDRRHGQAFALLVAAGLIRVEMWPFVAGYGAWISWRAGARTRTKVALGALTIPVLWFGGDWVGSGHLTTAAGRALRPIAGSPGAAAHPALAVAREAYDMLPLPAWIAIAAGVALALVRPRMTGAEPPGATRVRVTPIVVLAGLALAWTAIVAVMAQRGYPGLARFVFMACALEAVVAGVGAGMAVDVLGSAGAPRRFAAAGAILAFAVGAVPDARLLPADARAIDAIADLDSELARTVRSAGGSAAVADCGSPVTPWYTVTALAYDLQLPSQDVHDRPVGARPVVFKPERGDWRVSEARSCRLVTAKAS